jgi:hypothetical protein
MSKWIRSGIAVVVLIAGLVVATVAEPAAPGQRGAERAQLVVLSGPMLPGAHERFKAALDRVKPRAVVLDGPGGRLIEGVLIGTEIRRRGLSTIVPPNRSCASACAVAYLSGKQKFAGRGSAIGLHQASDSNARHDRAATVFMMDYLRSAGIPQKLLERRIRGNTIWWLSRAEQRALGIRNF